MKRTKQILSFLLSLMMALLCFACVPAAAADAPQIKSVIFMIGDGMGINHLRLAEQEGYTLFMEQNADLAGWSRTRSASSSVTDSAAGATALSCGVRIKNNQVCLFPDDTAAVPRIITENAAMHGMRVGIVTTDKTTGATPAGFSSHTGSRDNAADISAQQLVSGFDLIWGEKTSAVTKSAVSANGFTYVADVSGMRSLTAGTRSFGQFASDCWKLTPAAGSPTLAEMTEKSISLLSADAPEGFFLMVEGAHIDKRSHSTKDSGAVVDYPAKRADAAEAVAAFDRAVQIAAEYARQDGHTLVIVTADHETGNLYLEEETGEYTFHSGSHTGKDVPVFVYGAPDLFTEGQALDNRDFPNLIAARLGWAERFPISDPVSSEEPATEPAGETGQDDGDSSMSWWEIIKAFFKRIGDFFRKLFRLG